MQPNRIRPPYPYDPQTGKIEWPPKAENEIRAMIQSGNPIAAVKRVLDWPGAGLALAKKYVDDLAKR